jgi:hypothetical protein
METKEQIEARLLGYIEELCNIKKQDDYKSLSKYDCLKVKIARYIWEYARIVFPKGIRIKNDERNVVCHVCDCGVEINSFACDFVENFVYDPKKGNPIHYIVKVLKQKICHAGSENDKLEKRRGIRLSENKDDRSVDKRYRELVKICKKEDKDIKSPGVAEWLASHTKTSLSEIKDLISAHSIDFDDGKGIPSFEKIIAEIIYKKYDEDLEKKYKNFFSKIEQCYLSLQNRTKEFVSALITFNLLKEFEKCKESRVFIADLLSPYSFVEKSMLDSWKEEKGLGDQKDIAIKFKPGLSEASAESDASRTVKNFLDKLKRPVE